MKVGDLVEIEDGYYIVIRISVDTCPEIITAYCVETGEEVPFTIDDFFYWSRNDKTIQSKSNTK